MISIFWMFMFCFLDYTYKSLNYFSTLCISSIHTATDGRILLLLLLLLMIEWYSIVYILHLSIHISMNTWVTSTFCLLWIILRGIWVYRYLFKTLVSVLLGMYLEVELLDHDSNAIFNFVRNHHTVLHSCILYFHQHCTGFQFFRILTNICYFWFSDNSHPSGYEMVSHYGLCLCLCLSPRVSLINK